MQFTPDIAQYVEMVGIANGHRTQSSLAEAVGCSPTWMSLVLAGKRRASDPFVEKLENVLKLKPGTLKERHERPGKS